MSSDRSNKASSKLVGLHPAVPASCRAALREVMSDSGKPCVSPESLSPESTSAGSSSAGSADEQLAGLLQADLLQAMGHIEACGFCSARLQARANLAKWACARPTIPAALASPSVLEGIYERAAEAVEHGPIGEWLEQATVSATDATATDATATGTEVAATREAAASGGTDSSFLLDCLSESSSPNELLGDFVRGPKQPDIRVWNGVCRSILEGVASERVVRRQAGWGVLLVGAAAAAVVGLLSIQEDAPVQPTIIFADLDRAPDVAFANVRYGSRY